MQAEKHKQKLCTAERIEFPRTAAAHKTFFRPFCWISVFSSKQHTKSFASSVRSSISLFFVDSLFSAILADYLCKFRILSFGISISISNFQFEH